MARQDERTAPASPPAIEGERAALPPRYRFVSRLGAGGMAEVVRAHDGVLGRDVAVKLLARDRLEAAPARERFVREARAIARLDHPSIVRVHDVDGEAGVLVMDLVDGDTLGNLVEERARTDDETRAIGEQMLDALAAAHAEGIVHRDVKPSNIIVEPGGRAVLVDFGVARLTDTEVTRTGNILGTPAYMSPEQFRNDAVDVRSDLYSLGATLYHAVCGRRYDMLAETREDAIARLRRVASDRALARLIERCLERDPADRFASAPEAREALGRGVGSGRRRRTFALLGVGVALVVGVAFAAAQMADRDADRGVGSSEGGAVRDAATDKDHGLARALRLLQRGEYERAREALDAYLGDHPDDPDALAFRPLVAWFTDDTTYVRTVVNRALAAPLSGPQRVFVRGVHMLALGRNDEAAAMLEVAVEEHGTRPELLFLLGEAQWHGGRRAEGAATLRMAFLRDSEWQLAIHHVRDLHLAAGSAQELEPVVDLLRDRDASVAADLQVAILLMQRKYTEAVRSAQQAIENHPDALVLRLRLSEALILNSEFDAAERTLERALEKWPADERGQGAYTRLGELALYRGNLQEFYRAWESKRSLSTLVGVAWEHEVRHVFRRLPYLDGASMRPVPLEAAAYFHEVHVRGLENADDIAAYPDPEVRAYARGLSAEARDDLDGAARHYEDGLRLPQRGDVRMLLSHRLARARRTAGDVDGAAAACDEVIHPRIYQPYRAVVLPDCLVWRAEAETNAESRRALLRRLVDAWTGSFAHPSVARARTLLDEGG